MASYARATRDVAVASYERTIQTAFREVSDALAQRGRIGEQVEAQTARTNAERLSEAQFRAGVGSIVTVSPEGLRAENGLFGREDFAPVPVVLGNDRSPPPSA